MSTVNKALREGIGIHLPFGPVSQGENELQEDETEVQILQHCIDDWSDSISKGKGSHIIPITWSSDEIHDDTGRKPKGS